ncbi:hypothetical protein JYU15_01050 [bacterium AH-315-I18]|nr:hypothetical protein [Phycisphaeraceae bacterium]MBN4061000.1 hypothetical protein [bacterium AH-315-I18]
MNQQQFALDPKKTLLNLRIIWSAMLIGQLVFTMVVWFLNQSKQAVPFENIKSMYVIAVGFAMLSVMTGSFVRMQFYKKNWQNDCVTPRGYMTGHIISLACIEMACFFSLVVVMLHQTISTTMVLPVVLLIVFVLNFPNGKPMEPALPDFNRQL